LRNRLVFTFTAVLCSAAVATAFLSSRADARSADPSADRVEALLHVGPRQVGFTSVTLEDPASTRQVHLMIWYPTDDDVVSARPSTYPQVMPTGTSLVRLPFDLTAVDYSSFVEDRLVYDGVNVSAGPRPLVVHLAASATPGFVHIYEGVKFASHGFIFVSVTQALGTKCELDADGRLILDELFAWNATPGHQFQSAIEPDSVFGTGHSLGGRTWIASTSAHQECGSQAESRLRGLVLKEPTRETLTLAQMQQNVTPTFLNSQRGRQPQIDLQLNLGSRPMALTLQGVTPEPSATNHASFAQVCMAYQANLIAGNPANTFFPPPVVARCQDETFVAFEAFVAQQTSRYNLAFLKTLMGDGEYHAVLATEEPTDSRVEIVHWRHQAADTQPE
jgi:hypothetical protein